MTSTPLELEDSESSAVGLFLQAPSPGSYAPVFRLFAPRLVRYFRLRGCAVHLAEDLVQEVMLAVFRQAHLLRSHESFRAWIYRIARNAHLMHLRRAGRSAGTVEIDGLQDHLPVSGPDGYLRSLLRQSLAALDPLSRRILALRYIDGLEYHEISTVLDMPMGTVQWRVFQCKKKLARMMKGV
ncbi:MAG: RNA polymerase sigma factor [Candidatus Solibacter usitatus]|nr:RNA polymerase sigma factor [Candidatus Solibacter usitatus]